jgi:hypothetical protein
MGDERGHRGGSDVILEVLEVSVLSAASAPPHVRPFPVGKDRGKGGGGAGVGDKRGREVRFGVGEFSL